ncbi:DUF5301 domain-containing protein [Vagococcus sp. BWB3-3]|uniref:DUF5301 domain-containing protein n=1 Tax=Vagococcus allomyrinae TaxID=2794353 RepID=A0A940SSU3_9ENTE|nr:DUF5301 domain-containing protein [Vagococcus allomyrinae]
MNKSYSRIINRSSVNDSPYVDEVYTITLVKIQKESDILYVYKDENRCFIEKPYAGVYHASSKLFEFLDKKLSQ